MQRLRAGGFIALVFTLALVGCGDRGAHIVCPEIRIPQNTDRLIQYREGPGRDITDILLEAEVKFLSGECKVQDDEVVLTFPVAVGAKRGPANTRGTGNVSLFLAVTDQERNVLSRRNMPIQLSFPGNRVNIINAETVEFEIPKAEEQPVTDFLVFIGFELTREQLQFNREQPRR